MVVINNKNIKEFVGIVVSDAMTNTIVVSISVVKLHSLYKKRYTIYKKCYVHDVENIAKKWDKVKIRQCRPISKLKRWKLISVL